MGSPIYGSENLPDINPRTVTYQKGVSWDILCNVVSCTVQFVYAFFQSKLCDLIGLKSLFIIFIFLLGIMYLLFFFIRNRFVFFVMHIPIGLATVAYNNLLMVVVSLISAPEKLGANLALLNCSNVIGQQISNFGIDIGTAQAQPSKLGYLIGISCIFAF